MHLPPAHPFATYPCVCHTVGHPFLRRAVAAVVFISPFTLPPRLTVLLPNLPPCLTLPIRPTARLAALPTPDAVRRATPDRVPTKLLATPDDSGSGNRDSSKRRTSPVTRAFSPRGCDRLALPGTLTKRARSSRETKRRTRSIGWFRSTILTWIPLRRHVVIDLFFQSDLESRDTRSVVEMDTAYFRF